MEGRRPRRLQVQMQREIQLEGHRPVSPEASRGGPSVSTGANMSMRLIVRVATSRRGRRPSRCECRERLQGRICIPAVQLVKHLPVNSFHLRFLVVLSCFKSVKPGCGSLPVATPCAKRVGIRSFWSRTSNLRLLVVQFC